MMKNIERYFRFFVLVVLISVLSVCNLEAQTIQKTNKKRPKVGVVLCGGGAKGFAEIPILKAIEEAGVPIDYIGGTSIGSIMGALYAVGYDPDVMEQLVREQDWNTIIYDKIPDVLAPIDQKITDKKYFATFPITEGKIKVKSSVVEGVYVNLLLSRLMLPAYKTTNFNDLYVPFYCIATDVEHARPYEMTKGNLARSVRASMSIPFLFKPVRMNDKVLVDGGMVNNFPVRNMQKRGADIIIGVYLEDSIIPAEQIDNSLSLLESMMNLSSLDESTYGKENCDIYIRPNLHGRTMMSFNDFDSILQFGRDAANEFYPILKRLADSLQRISPYEINRPHVQPIDSVYIYDINIEGIPDAHKESVKREFSKSFPKKMSLKYIEEAVLKLTASGYYDDLWYEMADGPEGYILTLHCQENADKSTSFCIHYDNNYGIGALVNITAKNLTKSVNRSTLSLDINIAENPFVRVNFNKRHGKYFRYGADLKIVSLGMNQYDDKKITSSYSIQSNTLDIYTQFVPSLKQQIRIGAVADYVHIKDFVGGNGLDSDYSLYAYLYLNYFFGNEDATRFSRRGWKINITGKCVFFEGENNNGILSNTGALASFIVNGKIVKSIPIGKKNSLKLGAQMGYKLGANEVPQFYQFFVGGQSKMSYYDNIISFTGMNFISDVVNNILIGKVAWQWNFYKIFYSTVRFDFGYMNKSYDDWFNSGSFIAGAGLTIGADTVLGPVEVSLMGSNRNTGLVGFINVGYWF